MRTRNRLVTSRLTRSVTPDRRSGQGVDLKRKTAEVSSGRALSIEEAARKDSAVHVSLSSDSPVKQPGDLAIPAPGTPKAVEARNSRPKSAACSLASVRSFTGATSRRGGGAPWRPYIGFGA